MTAYLDLPHRAYTAALRDMVAARERSITQATGLAWTEMTRDLARLRGILAQEESRPPIEAQIQE